MVDLLAGLIARHGLDTKQLVETLRIFDDVGTALKPVAPVIAAYAQAPNQDLAWSAQRALVASGDRRGVEVLQLLLDRPDAWSWSWEDLILNQRENAAELLPVLKRTLHHPRWGNRAAAASVIGKFDLVQATQELVDSITPRDWVTSEAAVQALGRFVDRSAQARDALKQIANSYWSGRIRKEAADALAGKPGNTSDVVVCIGACAVDHRQPKCTKDGFPSRRYRLKSGDIARIDWHPAKRQPLPRVDITKLSSWCHEGLTASRRVANGWIVGCLGVESEGALGFLEDGAAQPQLLARMGVNFILPFKGETFVVASAPFEAGFAGAVYSVRQSPDGTWKLGIFSLLPSLPDAYATINSGFAFLDEDNAVFMDSNGDISTLGCMNSKSSPVTGH